MADQKVWVIADTHWNPNNIDSWVRRPVGYGERFMKMWRATVQPDDHIWHMGDVIIDAYDQVKEILDSLPGHKHLILGNHDWSKPPLWWMRNGFESAAHGVLYGRIWLSHHPAPFLPPHADVNVHGHCHQNRRVWQSFKPWHRFLCHEYNDYAPIQLEKFVSKYHKKYDVTHLDPESPDHKLPW